MLGDGYVNLALVCDGDSQDGKSDNSRSLFPQSDADQMMTTADLCS